MGSRVAVVQARAAREREAGAAGRRGALLSAEDSPTSAAGIKQGIADMVTKGGDPSEGGGDDDVGAEAGVAALALASSFEKGELGGQVWGYLIFYHHTGWPLLK